MIKQFLVFLILPLGLGLLLFSCRDKTDTLNIDYQTAYFPLDSGHYVTYQVDSIFSYSSDAARDTQSYQLMEVVGDTFYDNLGELNYELNLYRRENSNAQWNFDRKWYAKKGDRNVQKQEDDLRFIKLVFPPEQNKSWNGNAYIPDNDNYKDFKDWDYFFVNVNEPYSINSFSFDSSLTVSGVDDETFISKRKRKEVYAKNVGMVYQEYELKKKIIYTLPFSWDSSGWNGFCIRMRVIDHN